MLHLVYYFFDPETGELLYIGRTKNLPERIRYFRRRTGINPAVGGCQRHKTIEAACSAELKAIATHKPKLNKLLISSRGNFGLQVPVSAETKQRMSAASRGKPKSEEHRANMRKPKSPEHRAKLGRKVGYKVRPESIAKYIATRRANALLKRGTQN